MRSAGEADERRDERVRIGGQDERDLLPGAREYHIEEPAGGGERLAFLAVVVAAAERDDDGVGFAALGLVEVHDLHRGGVAGVDLGEGLRACGLAARVNFTKLERSSRREHARRQLYFRALRAGARRPGRPDPGDQPGCLPPAGEAMAADGFEADDVMHETPGSRRSPRPRASVLYRLGVQLICYDRPGYGGSDRHPRRTVADAATDVQAIANELGIDSFGVVGHSGGGPHALACAALLGDRVHSAANLAPSAVRRRGACRIRSARTVTVFQQESAWMELAIGWSIYA